MDTEIVEGKVDDEVMAEHYVLVCRIDKRPWFQPPVHDYIPVKGSVMAIADEWEALGYETKLVPVMLPVLNPELLEVS